MITIQNGTKHGQRGRAGTARTGNSAIRFTYARERGFAGVRVGVVGHRQQPRTLLFGLQTHGLASVHPVTASPSVRPVWQYRRTRPQRVSLLQNTKTYTVRLGYYVLHGKTNNLLLPRQLVLYILYGGSLRRQLEKRTTKPIREGFKRSRAYVLTSVQSKQRTHYKTRIPKFRRFL